MRVPQNMGGVLGVVWVELTGDPERPFRAQASIQRSIPLRAVALLEHALHEKLSEIADVSNAIAVDPAVEAAEPSRDGVVEVQVAPPTEEQQKKLTDGPRVVTIEQPDETKKGN